VLNSLALVKAGLAHRARRPGAVSAQILVGALVLEIGSCVLLARGIRDTVLESIVVNSGRVSTVASAPSIAVHHYLSVESNWSHKLVFHLDVESVSEG